MKHTYTLPLVCLFLWPEIDVAMLTFGKKTHAFIIYAREIMSGGVGISGRELYKYR